MPVPYGVSRKAREKKTFQFTDSVRGPLDDYSDALAKLVLLALERPTPPDPVWTAEDLARGYRARRLAAPPDPPTPEEAAHLERRREWRAKVREIGERLFKISGTEAMGTAHETIYNIVGGRAGRAVENAWNGIGGWYS